MSPHPTTIIALFQPPHLPPMEPLMDAERALAGASLELLDLSREIRAELDRLVALLRAHPAARRLVLLAAESPDRKPAAAWLPLMRAHLASQGLECEVVIPESARVQLSHETQAIRDTCESLKQVLNVIRGVPFPIVDISGGTRAMGLGALLACRQLGAACGYHAARYDAYGNADRLPDQWVSVA